MEKIIHQIWVGPYEIPNKERYFLERNIKVNPDFKHILWTDSNIPELPKEVQDLCTYFTDKKDYAFVADVLRIFLVNKYGGLYIDLDSRPHNGLSDLNLENYVGFFPYHDEFNVTNTFFGCSKETSYISYLYEQLLKSKPGDHFFPYWFNKGVKEYFNIEDLPDTEYFPKITEKCMATGKKLLKTWDEHNIKYLNLNREFNKYYQHIALHSWDSKHKEYFEGNSINYCEDIYNIQYKID
jgi:hypothetical protein